MTLAILVTIGLICGVLGAVLHEHRGHDRVNGFIIGALFGVLGLAYIALRPATSPSRP
jgi:sulfite exporter TauE/SafE